MSGVAMSKSMAQGRRNKSQWARLMIGLLLVVYLFSTYHLAQSGPYLQGLILVAAVFGILAVSLDLVAGITGLYSLGHAGLFAIGAYTTTLAATDLGVNVLLLLPISMVLTGIIGLVLGAVSLRVSGLYFAITTFVFTLVVTVLATDLQVTGGTQGLIGPIFPSFPGALSFLGQSVVWCVMLALLLSILLVWNIRRSPLYPVLLVIRDAEPFAEAAGVRTSLMKVGVFGLSAAMAGMAGWTFSFLGVVSPGQFNWTVSVNILVMVLLGGINTTLGPVVGAAFVSMFPDVVNLNPWWQEIIFGSLFVVVITVFPEGAAGVIKRGVEFLTATRRASGIQVPDNEAKPLEMNETLVKESEVRQPGTELSSQGMDREWNRPNEETHETDVTVACHGISFSYGEGPAVLTNVNLVVKRGTIHGLIGPNGSGKSTLVNIIAGRLKPLAGTITIKGQRVEGLGAHQRARYGMRRTFQAAQLVRELTGRDNVLTGLYTRVPRIAARALLWQLLPSGRRDMRSMEARADEALSSVGAATWAHRRMGDVPHGIEQLTQLASVCVAEPDIIILDEPATGLTSREVDHLARILSELKEAGVTMIVIEHQTRFLFPLCDEVTVLNGGEVVATGTASEIRANMVVREVYLGE